MKIFAHVMVQNLYRSLIVISISVFAISNTALPNQLIIQSTQHMVAAIVWQQTLTPVQLTSVIKKSIFKVALELSDEDIALHLLRTEKKVFERAALLNKDQEFGNIFNFSEMAYDHRASSPRIWSEIYAIQKTINRRESSQIQHKEMPKASSTTDPYWQDWYTYQKALKDKRYFDAYQLKMDIISKFTLYTNAKGSNCTICLRKILAGPPDYPQDARFQLNILACGHYLHDRCITTLKGTFFKCPICKDSLWSTSFFEGFSFLVKVDPREWKAES